MDRVHVPTTLLLTILLAGAALPNGNGNGNGNDTPKAGIKPTLDPDWTSEFAWRSIGPANMGGRILDIAVNPEDPCNYWIATAAGGLLRTKNNGQTYDYQFTHEGSASIGAVAVAPSEPTIVWVGTGEENPRNSCSYGDGVYKSEDGGDTFKRMGLEESFQVGSIAIHPENPDVVYIGALGRLYGPNEQRGLFKTEDGGKNWEKVLYIDEFTGVIDIDMHPSDPNTLIVATYERERDGFDTNSPAKKFGPGSGLHKTTDGGATWTKLSEGLPTGTLGRIGVDWYASDANIVYAIIETERIAKTPEDAAFMGLSGEDSDVGFKVRRVTKDGPSEAAGIEEGDFILTIDDTRMSNYEQFTTLLSNKRAGDKISVEYVREHEFTTVEIELSKRPKDSRDRSGWSSGLGGQRENLQDKQGPDGFETGGIFKSEDGGATWKRINSVNPRPMYYSQVRVDPSDSNHLYSLGTSLYRSKDGGETFTSDGARGGVHVDHHALWIDPKDGRHMILGNDGGIYVTYDRMENWDHHNHVAIGQFYHVTADTNALYNVYGGLQDNGSWGGPNRTRSRTGPVNSDWFRIGGGDGFLCLVDENDPDQIYYESQNGGMGRRNLATGEGGSARPRAPRGTRYRFNWKTPFLLSAHNSRIYYAAGNYVFRSLDKGSGMKRISPEITLGDRGSATAIAESSRDSDVLYVGTDDGAVWLTEDGGYAWKPLYEVAEVEVEEAAEEVEISTLDAVADADEVAPSPGAPVEALVALQDDDARDSAAEDVLTGTWAGKLISDDFSGDAGEFEMKLRLEGKKVRGEISSQMGDSTIEEGSFDAETGKLSMIAVSERGEFEFEATLEKGKLNGQLIAGGGVFTMDFVAEREGTVAAEDSAPEQDGDKADEAKKQDAEKKSATESKPKPEEDAEKADEKDSEETAEEEDDSVIGRGDTFDNKQSLTNLLPGPRWVSSIETSRHKGGRVYITFDAHRSDDDNPYVFVSEDEGKTWKSLVANLPRGSTRVIREDLKNKDLLYLGTEFGAWVSIDRGESWTRLLGDFPTVPVHEFAQPTAADEVVVGTHGRSLWVLDVSVLRDMNEDTLEADFHLYDPSDSIRWRSDPSPGASGTRRFVGQNGSSSVRIYYSLGSKAKDISLHVEDMAGDVVAELEASGDKGLHSVSWNMSRSSTDSNGRRRRGRSLPDGTYRVVLEIKGEKSSQEFKLIRDPDYPKATVTLDMVEAGIVDQYPVLDEEDDD